MIAEPRPHKPTPTEYLEWEMRQPLKHEYDSGQIWAMTGASAAHATVVSNLSREIGNHLRTSPCRVFVSDMKVQVAEEGPFFYPDLVVTCDERDSNASYTLQYPKLIIEVLSPSTEAFDRGGKFARYRHLSSLEEYVLIDSQGVGVECFRPGAEPRYTWILELYEPEGRLNLESIGLQLPVSLLYEKVRL